MRATLAPEPTMDVTVTVTFLRLDARPAAAPRALPAGATVNRIAAPTVGFYRYLYNSVGAAHLWWLRRVASDAEIAAIIGAPRLVLHVLYVGGAPAGFHEIDYRRVPDANLSYFGLLPHAVGRGLGTPFLRHAADTAFDAGARGLTVNTCTADSPRALPGYRRMGFKPVREIKETWQIPARLGLIPPSHLRG